jgi:hypothetical protein
MPFKLIRADGVFGNHNQAVAAAHVPHVRVGNAIRIAIVRRE